MEVILLERVGKLGQMGDVVRVKDGFARNFLLPKGKALRASDIDVMWLNGFGFPRYRGGLMYWADGIGVAEVYRQIQAWHQQYGERWAPAALLRRLAETGTPLREAKPGRPM